MKKFLRLSAWLLAAALVAALAFFTALKFYFTPARIKSLITAYAEANLGREISLDSAALGMNGFSIKNLRISEYPNFRKGQFFSAEDFSIRPDFRALLRKELKINSISAAGMEANITEVKKNTYNFSDLMDRPAAAAPGPKRPETGAASRPTAFGIAGISVKNSRLNYASADGTLRVALTDIKLRATSISGEGMFPFETEFKLKLNSLYLTGEFPVYAKGKADLKGLNVQRSRALIEKAVLKAGKITCELKGELENFLEPDAQMDLRIKPFSSTDLKALFPSVPARILLPAIDAASKFKLTTGKIVFRELDVKAGPVTGSLRGRLSWDPIFDYALDTSFTAQVPEMDSGDLAKKLRDIPIPRGFKIPLTEITAKATLKPGKIKLTETKLKAASLSAALSGDFSLEPVSASGKLSVNAGDIHDAADIVPALKPYELKGKAGGSFNFTFAKTASLNGGAVLEGVGAKFAGRTLSDLKGSINISKDRLSGEGMSGKLDGEALRLEISAKNYSTRPQLTMNLDIAAVRFASTPPAKGVAATGGNKTPSKANQKPAEKPFYFDLEGRTRLGAITHPNLSAGETVAKYNLKNVSEDFRNLSGQASFEISGGKFNELYALAAENKAAKVALYPLIILGKSAKLAKGLNLPDFNTITFSRMEGDYTFQDGLMKIQRSNLISDVADAATSGSVNLVTDSLDLKINTTLKEGSGIKMSAPVGMLVKGTFDSPSVKPDIKSFIDQPAVKKNLDKTIQEGAKLLKGLFK